jgi:hypothetical protein
MRLEGWSHKQSWFETALTRLLTMRIFVRLDGSSFRGARSANPESRGEQLEIPGSPLRGAPE